MFYAYCLSDEVTTGMLEGVAGVGGFALRLLQHGGVSVVVSEFAGKTVAATREHVLEHERVVGCVLRETTPLPFRFGTLASAERLESYVASQELRLKAALERVRGAVEMSVKIIWIPEDILRETEEETPVDEALIGEGTKFLLSKRRELMGDERLQERAEELRAWLEEFLSPVVKESHANVRPAERLVISASHLVLREHLDIYRAQLAAARERCPELRFLTSGPWPPYSFSNLSSR